MPVAPPAADGTAWFHLPGEAGRLQLWPHKAAFDPDHGPLGIGPWALVHEPKTALGAYALAGDAHPCAVLSGRGDDQRFVVAGDQVAPLPVRG
jgi:hypothetical protein